MTEHRPTEAASANRDLPLQTRLATTAPASAVAEARTVEVTWSTGAAVRRYDWWKDRQYEEVLSLAAGDVDLARLNGGAPLLNAHGTYELADQIGVVERAWLQDGEGRALVRFSPREDVTPIWEDVRAGILRNISVGYQVRKYEIVEEDGKLPVYRAVDWLPMEISMVPVPADAGAQTRAAGAKNHPAQGRTYPCEFVPQTRGQSTEYDMSDKNKPTADPSAETTSAADKPAAPETRAAPDAAAIRAEVTARITGIHELCRQHGVPADRESDMVARNLTVEQAGLEILRGLAAKSDATQERSRTHIVRDEGDSLRDGIEEALLHRYKPDDFKLTDKGREFRGLSLMEIGADFHSRAGVKLRGLDKMERAGVFLGLTRAGGMLGTTDFPNILANIATKTLRKGFELAPSSWRNYCSVGTLPDFKSATRVALGEAPQLLKVLPSGEITRGAIGEAAESIALSTYARIIAINRQTIVNDDLQAFTRVPSLYGFAAADLISTTVVAILTANAAMADTVALFHTTHANIGAAAPTIGDAGLAEMKLAMRVQKGLDAVQIVGVPAKGLIVPAALENTAKKYLVSLTSPTQPSEVNTHFNTLTLSVEPKLDAASATKWYGHADPNQMDTIEVAFLEGQEGPFVETRMGFEVDGVEIKCRQDVGAKAIEYRGLWASA